jgi:hypothetical protein
MTAVRALSLFSGGLDSICATRLVMEQGIEVIGVKFVSPFFGYDILRDPDSYIRDVREKYGITVMVVDISDDYLRMLRNPLHGFGRYFNPCVDCKIYMMNRAKALLEELGASFLISGEVLGQRPMSQRRDTLNVIERDSGTRTILLRPLSAKLLKETEAELNGLVDRARLLDFSGRGRSRQIALAKHFGISDYPSPAGGCILADPILSRRVARVYEGGFVVTPETMSVVDVELMLIGRQFLLPGGGWLVLGRDEKENIRLGELREEGDIHILIEERPGPESTLRKGGEIYADEGQRARDLGYAASLVARYAKKINGKPAAGMIKIADGASVVEQTAEPLDDKQFETWQM